MSNQISLRLILNDADQYREYGVDDWTISEHGAVILMKIDMEKEELGMILLHCCFVHHKSHKFWPEIEIEIRLPQWEAGD